MKIDTNTRIVTVICCYIIVIALIIAVFWTILPNNLSEKQSSNLPNAIENSEDWGGYCPFKIYTVFNKHTGVYYGVTETGSITPLYTIEGEVMLVDQGNEYVVHRNLGEPVDAQE